MILPYSVYYWKLSWCLHFAIESVYFSSSEICVDRLRATVWFWTGGGLVKLHDDIQTCGYEDVQVMWEMLRRSDSDLTSNQTTKRKQRPFWRVFVLSNSNRSDSSSFAPSHA